MVIRSVTAAQVPIPVEVSVSVTDPAVVSARDGIYVAFRVFLFGVKVPVPVDVHLPPDAFKTIPFSGAVEPLQIVWSLFAFTIGIGLMVNVIFLVTGVQGVLPFAVKDSTTDLAAVSAAEGKYVGFTTVEDGPKIPDPEVDQLTEVLFVTVGLYVMPVLKISAQMVDEFNPVIADLGIIDNVIWLDTGLQFPFPVDVMVSITVPAALSIAEGV